MVGDRGKFYLVTGGKSSQRNKTIDNIKKKILKEEAFPLNSIVLQAGNLDLESFKVSVFTLSFHKKKIFLIKDFTDLPESAKVFLGQNLSKILNFNYFIFESEIPYSALKIKKKILNDDFFRLVFKKSVKYQGEIDLEPVPAIESFRKRLYRNDFKGCLFDVERMLNSKSKEKIVSAQVLGLIISKISRTHNCQKKEKAFNMAWETDRALKTTNIDARLLIERLLVSLI